MQERNNQKKIMQPTPQELAETYASKSDDELRSLHALGTLTETAYEVLERELRSRSIDVPERPSPAQVEEQARREYDSTTLAAHWQGRASLASAYWLVGTLGLGIMAGLAVLTKMFVPALLPIAALLIIAFLIFAWVSIWRCWRNTRTPIWGYVARGMVVIYVFPCTLGLFRGCNEALERTYVSPLPMTSGLSCAGDLFCRRDGRWIQLAPPSPVEVALPSRQP